MSDVTITFAKQMQHMVETGYIPESYWHNSNYVINWDTEMMECLGYVHTHLICGDIQIYTADFYQPLRTNSELPLSQSHSSQLVVELWNASALIHFRINSYEVASELVLDWFWNDLQCKKSFKVDSILHVLQNWR